MNVVVVLLPGLDVPLLNNVMLNYSLFSGTMDNRIDRAYGSNYTCYQTKIRNKVPGIE